MALVVTTTSLHQVDPGLDRRIERPTNPQRSGGFRVLALDVTEADFNRKHSVVQLRYPPDRIDLITSIDGVDFDQARERRMPVEVDDLILNVIGRENLIRNKIAAGHAQDPADVERLRTSAARIGVQGSRGVMRASSALEALHCQLTSPRGM